MLTSLRAVIAILVSVLLLSTGQGLHQALIPSAVPLFSFHAEILPFLTAAYFGGYLAGCFGAPILIRRVGHVRSLAIFASLLAVFSLFHFLIPDELVWTCTRVFVGFCFAAIDVILESWLADQAPEHGRGKVLAFYRFTDLLALSVGQFLISIAAPDEFLLYALVTIFVCLAVIPSSASSSPAPVLPQTAKVRVWHVWKVSPLAMVLALFHGMASSLYWGYVPLYAENLSYGSTFSGQFLALVLAGAAIAQFPLGWASDRFDRRKLLISFTGLAAITALLIEITSGQSRGYALSGAFVFGVFSFSVFPLLASHAMDKARKEDLTEIGAALLVVYGSGAFLSPFIYATLPHIKRGNWIFYSIAGIYAFSCFYAFLRWRGKAPIPQEETVQHLHLSPTTPAVLELDPTEEEAHEPNTR